MTVLQLRTDRNSWVKCRNRRSEAVSLLPADPLPVDLSGQLSKPRPAVLKLLNSPLAQVRAPMAPSARRATRQTQVRLSRQQQLGLVERYRAGALRRELAEVYGIGTGTVSAILKRHDASRKIGLTPEEIEDAAERYETGQSLAQIAEAFAVVANTIRAALLAHSITLRSTSA